MTKDGAEAAGGCRNESCRRPAEMGEEYCFACGLEWSLLHREGWRDARRERGQRPPARSSAARR